MRCFIVVAIFICVNACTASADEAGDEYETQNILATTDLQIGLLDQSSDHQLGGPVAVRTDSDNIIYIADRIGKTVKKFEPTGEFIENLGGWGRGPGEIQDIELMEITPEETFVIIDRGNLRYLEIDKTGEQINTFPYNMSDQYYPQAIAFIDDDKMMSLFFESSSTQEIPFFERHLFHVYIRDFQTRLDSFFQIQEAGVESMMEWVSYIHPGSFVLNNEGNTLFYSPVDYDGEIYQFTKTNGTWSRGISIFGVEPSIARYEEFSSDADYENSIKKGVPRSLSVSFAQDKYLYRQLTMEAGLFLTGDGKLIHFYAQTNPDGVVDYDMSDVNPMDLYVQIFDANGDLEEQSYLFTYEEQTRSARRQAVNWMDRNGNFYLIDYPDEVPTIRRFSLEYSEL